MKSSLRDRCARSARQRPGRPQPGCRRVLRNLQLRKVYESRETQNATEIAEVDRALPADRAISLAGKYPAAC